MAKKITLLLKGLTAEQQVRYKGTFLKARPKGTLEEFLLFDTFDPEEKKGYLEKFVRMNKNGSPKEFKRLQKIAAEKARLRVASGGGYDVAILASGHRMHGLSGRDESVGEVLDQFKL